MPTRQLIAALAALLALPAAAQEDGQPLSAIGWLSEPPPASRMPGTVLLEPPVSDSVLPPEVAVTPLEALLPPIGLVGPAATGLPVDLWRGSRAEVLAGLIRDVPVKGHPAMQSLLFTLLLSETRAPAGTQAQEALLLARLERLMELGAPDPAQALAQQAGPADSPDRFARWFDATLLTGDEDRACAALTARPHLSPDYAPQVYCAMKRGDWPTAALLLDSAGTLGLMEQEDFLLLDAFLTLEMSEHAPPLPRPDAPTPLEFRIFEAIGEPMPTAPLPRAFAAADLRDLAGWKAQLEASERLTRSGALNPNHLLGLYTQRDPSASGGIWDRVAALQGFEAALNSGDAAAVAETLPPVWEAMQDAGIEVAFADLFAERLAAFNLDGDAGELAWRIRLLSPDYETAAQNLPSKTRANRYLAALAQGEPGRAAAPSDMAEAISAGFAPGAVPPADLQEKLSRGQLGEVILRAMKLYHRGAAGNYADLADALATFRTVGLEDTARQAALQLMLLERG